MLCDCIINMETMTAKEKAIEIFEKYKFVEIANYTSKFEVKECALICINEIIAELESERVFERLDYWNEVKEEINKL